MGLGLAYCHLMYHISVMVALLIELVGGPECGKWVEVEYIGRGLLVVRGYLYLWEAEDTGAPYLRYVGETP